ncbi:hypothetical protein CMT19_16765 [Elizabethkingia anophelis]|nr:hypothetical protein [Elizabethkingia anophelis]
MSKKSIHRLSTLIKKYLGQEKQYILEKWGESKNKYSDNQIWIYTKQRSIIFQDEIIFILENNIVVDITLTEYIFWIARKNIFYYEREIPEYKIVDINIAFLNRK